VPPDTTEKCASIGSTDQLSGTGAISLSFCASPRRPAREQLPHCGALQHPSGLKGLRFNQKRCVQGVKYPGECMLLSGRRPRKGDFTEPLTEDAGLRYMPPSDPREARAHPGTACGETRSLICHRQSVVVRVLGLLPRDDRDLALDRLAF